MPWAAFVRQFGDVREVGAGRRDREKIHLHPNSPAEVLFYRALLGRAFFDTDKGPLEFAYIPDDLLQLIEQHKIDSESPNPTGRAAMPAEHARVKAATDRLLDDGTTLLAALRIDHPTADDAVLRGLLEAAGILRAGVPHAASVKTFLEMPRAGALHLLVEAWQRSERFNELRMLPGLTCEGTWVNDPRATRQFILERLKTVPTATWWSLPAFIAGIKRQHADFQRPAGDYDTWFIKREADGSYLRGFVSWDDVDGALIRFVIADVMHRLGLVDLASAAADEAPSAFRVRGESASSPSSSEGGRLYIGSQGRIAAARDVARAVRYQLSRFCEWDAPLEDKYRYRITPESLTRARRQGLKVEHLLALLASHSDAGIPPVLVKALKRWDKNGSEARAEARVVLKVSKPQILDELRRSKAARFLGEALGPTTVIIKKGAVQKVAEAMAELGLLLENGTTGGDESGH